MSHPSQTTKHTWKTWNPIELCFGPIFQADLRTDGRRKRSYIRWSLYLLILLCILSLSFYGMWNEQDGNTGAAAIQTVQNLAPQIAMVIAWVQFIVISLITPSLAAGSLARERSRRTLPALLTTPMKAQHIALNKISASSFHAIIMVLLALPILLSVRIFGGLPLNIIIGFETLTITTIILASALGLIGALGATSSRHASGAGLGLLIALQFVPWIILGITGRVFHIPINQIWYAISSPFMAMVDLSTQAFGFGSSVTLLGLPAWVWASLLNLFLALVVTVLTSLILRKSLSKQLSPKVKLSRKQRKQLKKHKKRLKKTGGHAIDSPTTKPVVISRKNRTVSDHPLLWHELHTLPVNTPGKYFKVLILILLCTSLLFLRFDYYGPGQWQFRLAIDDMLPYMLMAIITISLSCLLVATHAASSITREREAKTWETLLTTRQSNFSILFAKCVGALCSVWIGPACFLLTVAIAGVLASDLPFVTLIHLALIMAGPMMLVAATGVLISLQCKQTNTATVLNVLLGVGLYAVFPILFLWFYNVLFWTLSLDNDYVVSALATLHPFAMAGFSLEQLENHQSTYTIGDYSDLSAFAFTLVVFADFMFYALVSWIILKIANHLFPAKAPRVS